jgi:hypothetical protein
MLVLADADRGAEEFLKRAHGRVLDQVLCRRCRQRRTSIHIDVSAGPLANLRIATCDKQMTIIQLEQERIPTDILTDNSVGDIALTPSRYIVDDIDNRRLARL